MTEPSSRDLGGDPGLAGNRAIAWTLLGILWGLVAAAAWLLVPLLVAPPSLSLTAGAGVFVAGMVAATIQAIRRRSASWLIVAAVVLAFVSAFALALLEAG